MTKGVGEGEWRPIRGKEKSKQKRSGRKERGMESKSELLLENITQNYISVLSKKALT